MAEVTVKAEQTFGGIQAGEVVTVERTEYIDRKIKSGRLSVVDGDVLIGEGDPIGDDGDGDLTDADKLLGELLDGPEDGDDDGAGGA